MYTRATERVLLYEQKPVHVNWDVHELTQTRLGEHASALNHIMDTY